MIHLYINQFLVVLSITYETQRTQKKSNKVDSNQRTQIVKGELGFDENNLKINKL